MHDTLTMHGYQDRAVDFGIKTKTPFFAIDMGLGKTIINLKIIEKLAIPAFVIAPINPMYTVWPAEIEKWGLNLTFDILHGSWKDDVFEETNADVLITSYSMIKWLHDKLAKTKCRWTHRMLILDESSMIKSNTTKRFKMLSRMFPLWNDYRIMNSATPSPNGYHELWTQYYMLDKGQRLYGDYTRYRGNYFHYSGSPRYETKLRQGCDKEIQAKVHDITFRLKDTDYLKMPPITYNEIPLVLPQRKQNQYKELEKNFFLEFEAGDATAWNAAALSMKLRQYIQGALYLDDTDGEFQRVHNVKLDALEDIVTTSAGKPILCPIQFKFEKQLILERFPSTPVIAGGTKPTEARYYIEQWNKGNIPLLLCHPASISHGNNLQAGGHIILWYGLTWSLEHYQQLNGRIYRQGQSEAVIIHHLIMKGTVDERVFEVLKRKDATQQDFLNSLRR